jgi:O-antigen ligase
LGTGADLFAYKGSELVRAGERRVNGPFAADSSYSIICLVLFLFLRAAPAALSIRFDRTSRTLYECALGAALIASLLPMFRTIAIALVACWAILELGSGKTRALNAGSRLAGRWLIAALIAFVALGATVAPALFARRLSDPSNAFSRVATWEAAAEIAIEHPLFGVGLANYGDYFGEKYSWEDESVEEVMNTSALSSPHSNLVWIAAELGWVAFAVYLIANVWLALMGWRALKRARTATQRAAAACFLSLVVAYWITGLTLTSGLYSDLNLYFFFLAGLLSSRFDCEANETSDLRAPIQTTT